MIEIKVDNPKDKENIENFIKALSKDLVDKFSKVEINTEKNLIFTGYLDYQSSSVEIPYSDVLEILNKKNDDGYGQIFVHVIMNKIDIFYNFILIKTDGFDIKFKKVR